MEGYSEREVVAYAFSKDVILSPDAAKLLVGLDYRKVIDELVAKGHFIITYDLIQSFLNPPSPPKIEEAVEEEKEEVKEKEQEVEVVVERKKEFPAKEVDYKPRVDWDRDVTGKEGVRGTPEDFIEYFRYRFEKLASFLRGKGYGVRPISRFYKITPGSEFACIGMVVEKTMTKNQSIMVVLEDEEAQLRAIFPKNSEIYEKAKQILPDDVILVRGRKGRGDILIGDEIRWPDVPLHTPSHAKEPISAVITSDWHIGSKLVIKEALDRFLAWIKGEYGDPKLKELARSVKYLIIAGDLVDGIGIYPNQMDELEIADIYAQYEAFVKLIQDIPEHIYVVIIPGNHDAVRREEPQPAIPKEFAKELYEMDNVIMAGSPTYVDLAGVEFLLYHGTSLDDVIAYHPKLNYDHPEQALVEYLRRRHLVPMYGVKSPIVPEKRDYLLIDKVPDVFVAGHVHRNGYTNYRGITVISSGTWQDVTPYQIENGHVPTPGRVPVLNLQTLRITEIRFWEGE